MKIDNKKLCRKWVKKKGRKREKSKNKRKE